MRDFATTPSIDITIGRQTRLYHAFVTTAPVALDSPSTVTLYTSTLVDLAGFNPPGKLADAELHFTSGALDGLKLIGFGIWERRNNGGRNVTFPARPVQRQR